MSLFDDIPLPVGTTYYDKTIIDWNPDEQKYHVEWLAGILEKETKWLPRGVVERHHGSSLMEGVETRQANPGTSYNTRYFRSKT